MNGVKLNESFAQTMQTGGYSPGRIHVSLINEISSITRGSLTTLQRRCIVSGNEKRY